MKRKLIIWLTFIAISVTLTRIADSDPEISFTFNACTIGIFLIFFYLLYLTTKRIEKLKIEPKNTQIRYNKKMLL